MDQVKIDGVVYNIFSKNISDNGLNDRFDLILQRPKGKIKYFACQFIKSGNCTPVSSLGALLHETL